MSVYSEVTIHPYRVVISLFVNISNNNNNYYYYNKNQSNLAKCESLWQVTRLLA